MSLNLNKVILGGRVASEPEQKQTPSGVSVVTYSMAVGRRFVTEGQERETDFFRVTGLNEQEYSEVAENAETLAGMKQIMGFKKFY